MRKALTVSAVALAIASFFPGPAAIADSAPAASLVQANRFGLPDFADLVEEVGGAVVNIAVVHRIATADAGPMMDDPMFDLLRRFGVPMPNIPMPERGPRTNRGIGSGFIITADGYVLTNAHVVSERGADTQVTVRLSDGREFNAQVIGTDQRTDIALLKIEATDLPTVKTGDPEMSRVGEWVVAMGAPFGFEQTVTAGIISAKARRLPSENFVPFIQTDVAINPGNSGGPLFNLAGEVIGINAQIYSRSGGFMGISFSIPIDVALNVKDQLLEFGRVQRGKLGVTIQPVDQDLAQTFGLDEPTGALVANVEPGSAAEKAGLQPGDVVLAVDGVKVDSSADLPRMIGEKRPATQIQIDVWRDGGKRTLRATLDELQPDTIASAPVQSPVEQADTRLGVTLRPLSNQEASRLNVRGGVVIESVTGEAAEAAGLRAGDIVLSINNRPISNVAEFRRLVANAGKRFALLVQRGDSRIFIPVRID